MAAPDSPFGIPWAAGPTEPTAQQRADVKEGVAALRHLYLALIAEGFSEEQALTLTAELAKGAA